MSRVILEGFKTDPTTENINAILTKDLVWYDKINQRIKVGAKVLNYYTDPTGGADGGPIKVLTTLTQAEAPTKVISPVEFTVLS